jgi:hypothetical protein
MMRRGALGEPCRQPASCADRLQARAHRGVAARQDAGQHRQPAGAVDVSVGVQDGEERRRDPRDAQVQGRGLGRDQVVGDTGVDALDPRQPAEVLARRVARPVVEHEHAWERLRVPPDRAQAEADGVERLEVGDEKGDVHGRLLGC